LQNYIGLVSVSNVKFIGIEIYLTFHFISDVGIPADWTVNTKVDMWFNVENEYWLSERVRSGREDYTNGLCSANIFSSLPNHVINSLSLC
jgi:hypothetical protein